jgi:flagellar biosynthesis/type III secretory pathway M-ring protein FliF/YscJ
MRTVFLTPAFSIAVTAALTTYLGWDKEAAIIGGLALAVCLTLLAMGIEDTIRKRRAKEEEQQRELEHWRQPERQRAGEEKTRASPKQPTKERGSTAQPKSRATTRPNKSRAPATQAKKSRVSATRPKKEPGRSPS